MLRQAAALMPVSSILILLDFHIKQKDVDYLRQYLTQVRQELAARLVERLYADGTGKPSKWWMSFQKRRFMNRSLGS